ncbi:MAG: hypothetical protein QJR14_06340 [Bacillota bacterium]|nr:hypothetical protein [Bacillota bacterium]
MATPPVKEVSRRTGTASPAWIALFGALIGVTALIPIFPYVGGGGYVPLLVPFSAMAPMLLGPAGGIFASVIGGLIGMFIAPAAFPLGIVDVLETGIAPAFFTALMLNNDRYYAWNIPILAIFSAFAVLFPYYIPGPAAGFPYPPEPLYVLISAIYWLPTLVVAILPFGRRTLPAWARSDEPRRRYFGLLIILVLSLYMWWNPWTRPYWYVFHYPVKLALATFVGYIWWVPALSVITAVLAAAILEALKRSGLPKVERALW